MPPKARDADARKKGKQKAQQAGGGAAAARSDTPRAADAAKPPQLLLDFNSPMFTQALVIAADSGNSEDVAGLLQMGVSASACADAEIDLDGKRQQTRVPALFAAVRNGHLRIVQQLLAAGADVEADVSGTTALFKAAVGGNVPIVAALLAAGADAGAADSSGCPPLSAAASAGNTAIIQLLLAAGACVCTKDMHDGTALTYAAYKGRRNAALLLLKAGASPHALVDCGSSCYMQAAQCGHFRTAALLSWWRKRTCAACGAARANGAHLFACHGCGGASGVRYCDNACAREHWVKGRHRTECEWVQARLKGKPAAAAGGQE